MKALVSLGLLLVTLSAVATFAYLLLEVTKLAGVIT